MKKLIIFVLFMLSLTLVLPNNANKVKAYSNNIVLSNSHAESAALGSDVESVFKLESGNDVISFQLTFKYDATKYAFKSLTKLDGLVSKPIVNSKNEGIIKVVYSGVKEIVAGSDIFNIVLTVKEDAMEGQDAFITIDEEAENLFSLFTNGEQIDEEVFNTSFKKINIGLYGDVDGDGVVGINDVTKILLHVVGTKELEGKQLQKADINQDGKVNVSDATKIQLYLAKMIDSLIPETIYKVTFLDINGNVIAVREVEKGQAAVAPSAPEVEGYSFTGWDTDFTKVEQDLTVKAVYKKILLNDEDIIEAFAEEMVNLFNTKGKEGADSVTTIKENFQGSTHPNIKYVFDDAETLAEYKWLFEYVLADLNANTDYDYEDTRAQVTEMLTRMIAGDTTAISGSYANGRSCFRQFIHEMINANDPTANPGNSAYNQHSSDYTVAENYAKLIAALKAR